MTARLRLGRRLLARLAGEVRVHGLRAPARARWGDGRWQIEAEHDADVPLIDGVVAAAHALRALDLARRTWSGRLSEVFGRRPLTGDLDTVEHDLFVRLLGFRGRAERAFRASPDRDSARAEQVAAGINAWIDDGPWADDPGWRRLGTRPRLFGAADVLLLAVGPILADRAAGPVSGEHPLAEPVSARLNLLRDPLMRGPQGFAAPLPRGLGLHREPGPLAVRFPTGSAATLVPEEVLPGGDDHRIVTESGWARLSVSRPDVAVRGAGPERPWLRTGPRGPLISDLLGAKGDPPTGPATALAWERVPDVGGADAGIGHESGTPPAVRSIRLVPLDEGA